jgi:homogentisate 1,2-dioxygenase
MSLPDIQEIFGSHYELPELGPLGSNGMALPRDFEHPVASFDMDTSEWESEFLYLNEPWQLRKLICL